MPNVARADEATVPLFMTVEVTGPKAFAEFLEYLAGEVRRGTVDRVSVETQSDGTTRASVVFNTHQIAPIPLAVRDDANVEELEELDGDTLPGI